MSRSGSIPIDRGGRTKTLSKMMAAAQKAKEEGRPIVIFPEGTRCAPGETRPYKSGVAALYQDLQLPVVPMALNSGLLWPRNSLFKKTGHDHRSILARHSGWFDPRRYDATTA